MAIFSERYGYTKVSELLIREEIPESIKNSILNWLHLVERSIGQNNYEKLEKEVWVYFLNKDLRKLSTTYFTKAIVISSEIEKNNLLWYEKLNLIEFILPSIKTVIVQSDYLSLIKSLNNEFKRHNFSYRIVGDMIEEITSKVEIDSVETALINPNNSVQIHLHAALNSLSASQKNPDYRNSIKESISAVEVYCREKTGESTLGKAISKLESKGIILPNVLKKAFELQYSYTNDKTSGIRHALMDDTKPPSSGEAIYMLVSCSAFINYLVQKS